MEKIAFPVSILRFSWAFHLYLAGAVLRLERPNLDHKYHPLSLCMFVFTEGTHGNGFQMRNDFHSNARHYNGKLQIWEAEPSTVDRILFCAKQLNNASLSIGHKLFLCSISFAWFTINQNIRPQICCAIFFISENVRKLSEFPLPFSWKPLLNMRLVAKSLYAYKRKLRM